MSIHSVTKVVVLGLVLLSTACDQQEVDPLPLTEDQNEFGQSPATQWTKQANGRVEAQLPLDSQLDFEAAKRGFIAKLETDEAFSVWDEPSMAFLEGEAPASVNPSLWRQSVLNNISGLFQVTDRIYQVRGYDLANMSIIEGDTGRIIVDPLTTVETAVRAMELVEKELGPRPLAAIIVTHSHVDHFGGVRALASQEDIATGKVRVIAPLGFFEESVSENVLAGTVMGRRADYMYGRQLPRNARGHLGSGLGVGVPQGGTYSLPQPNELVDRTGQTKTIDGVEFEFQYAPESEAPAELTFFLPQFRAICGAEIVSRTMHNLYTLRGAKVRDALKWTGYIDEIVQNWSHQADIVFNSHHWPVWGKEEVVDYLKKQRDTYKFIHDQTLRLASKGMTPKEISEAIELPASLAQSFANRGYYGTTKHNAKAVYQHYFGWYDGNPANLDPLPPEQAGERYVAAMGGPQAVIDQASGAFDQGEYRWAATLLSHLVFSDPEHQEGRALLARTFEQLGYQAESGPWRDVYLSGALELRSGVKASPPVRSAEILIALPLNLFFDALAANFKAEEAEGKDLRLNFVFSDEQASYLVEVENAVLHHRETEPDPSADATITLTRAFWLRLLGGGAGVSDLLTSDEISVEGSRLKLLSFLSLLDQPDEQFAIVTP